MKRAIGIICMILGAALISCALWLFAGNEQEEELAQSMTEEYLPQIMELIQEKTDESHSSQINTSYISEVVPEDIHDPNGDYVGNMLVTEIDGYGFIGYISIPKLGLELPVVSETDMDVMKLAPCRFSGSPKTNDLVVGAHNYERHFGNIDKLSKGDTVLFTDMEGITWEYRVEFTELLLESDTEELAKGEFPLTIYTCTYDGNSRVTVRCKSVQ